MQKLASTKVAEVLAQVPVALRAQQEEIAQLREKVAHYEKRDRVIKIASAMQAKNLDPETSYEEKITNLMDSENLDVVEKAIDLSAPQIKLAALTDHPGNASDAESAFIAGLVDG